MRSGGAAIGACFVRETVAGHRLGALEAAGGVPPPFQCIPPTPPHEHVGGSEMTPGPQTRALCETCLYVLVSCVSFALGRCTLDARVQFYGPRDAPNSLMHANARCHHHMTSRGLLLFHRVLFDS